MWSIGHTEWDQVRFKSHHRVVCGLQRALCNFISANSLCWTAFASANTHWQSWTGLVCFRRCDVYPHMFNFHWIIIIHSCFLRRCCQFSITIIIGLLKFFLWLGGPTEWKRGKIYCGLTRRHLLASHLTPIITFLHISVLLYLLLFCLSVVDDEAAVELNLHF